MLRYSYYLKTVLKENLVNIVVFGANGPTGRLVTRIAAEAGHRVTAVTRSPEALDSPHPGVRVVGGDGFGLDCLRHAMRGQDAVLSAPGVPYGRDQLSPY